MSGTELTNGSIPHATKKALCIGINNYPGTDSDLLGCVNDANDWKSVLEDRGFAVHLLLDSQATKNAMRQGIQRLVREARSGDIVVVTYSGHGSWIPDTRGDENDARDEVLCPYDIAQNRPLSDDELYDLFADREPDVRIVFISDSCHSGSVSRMLPTRGREDEGRARFLPPESFLPSGALRAASAREAHPRNGAPRRPFEGVLLSGCQDTEFSYDADFNQRPNGAFTYFALKSLKSLPTDASYRDWFRAIRAHLPNQRQRQTPNYGGTRSQMAWQVFALEMESIHSDISEAQADAGGSVQYGLNAEPTGFSQPNRRFTLETTTTTQVGIEKTVRKVLAKVLNEVSDELTSTPGEPTTNGKASRALTSRAARGATGQPPTSPPPGGSADEDEAGTPDDSADEDEAQAIPPAVFTAVKKVCRDLSPEQAKALASMFEAMSGQAEEEAEGEADDEETAAEDDGDIELGSIKEARTRGESLARARGAGAVIRLLKKSGLLKAAARAAKKGVKAFKGWVDDLSSFNPAKWAIKALPDIVFHGLIEQLTGMF
jgi:metacaspase-1